MQKNVARVSETHPVGEGTPKNEKPPVRFATAEQFKKAHEKTSKLHARLFRRLAE